MPHRPLWTRNRGDLEPVSGVVRMPGGPGVRVPPPRDLTGQLVVGTVRRRVDNVIVQQSVVEVVDGAGGRFEMAVSPTLAESTGLHSLVLTSIGESWSWPDPLNPAWLQVLEPAGASLGTSVRLPAGSTWTNRGAALLMAGTFDPANLELALLTVASPLAAVRLWDSSADLVGEVAAVGYARVPLVSPEVVEDDVTSEATLSFADVLISGLTWPSPVVSVAVLDRSSGAVVWSAAIEHPMPLDGSPFQVSIGAAGTSAVCPPASVTTAPVPVGASHAGGTVLVEDITIYRGDSFSIIVEVSLPGMTPALVSTWTARAQVRPFAGAPSSVAMAVTQSVEVDNELRIVAQLSPAETSVILPGVWDMELEGPGGSVHTVVRGAVRVQEDVTR